MTVDITLLAQQTSGGAFLPALVLGGVAVALVLGFVLERQKRKRKQEALQRLLARDASLRETAVPLGETSTSLAGMPATPRGDRRCGLRYGVTGPLDVPIDGRRTQVECAAFQWWYEDRRTTRSQNGSRTHYVELTRVVAAVRLPAEIPDDLRLTPESMLGRVGLTRGGQQLESSEFNRRFRVDARSRTLAIRLLDARMQRLLLEEFDGRFLQLRGSLLLIGGSPRHRDDSLAGVIGELPAVRQDAHRLMEHIPSQFWRALALEPEA